jgi:hypothetical protein
MHQSDESAWHPSSFKVYKHANPVYYISLWDESLKWPGCIDTGSVNMMSNSSQESKLHFMPFWKGAIFIRILALYPNLKWCLWEFDLKNALPHTRSDKDVTKLNLEDNRQLSLRRCLSRSLCMCTIWSLHVTLSSCVGAQDLFFGIENKQVQPPLPYPRALQDSPVARSRWAKIVPPRPAWLYCSVQRESASTGAVLQASQGKIVEAILLSSHLCSLPPNP